MATSPWIVGLARLGYAAKGIVYLIIGALALALAVGHGGAATDQRGALRTIYEQPFGKFLLIVIAIGLAGYALWSLIRAFFDTEGKGTRPQGLLARAGYAAVGIAYALLSWGAFGLALGTGTAGQSSTTSTQDWTARLLKLPLGQALVVIVGLIVLGIALYLFYRAYKAKFQQRLNLSSMSARSRKWIVDLGRLGYGALGVVFTIIGFFLVIAALRNDPSKAKGLDSALQQLLHQPFGPLLLAIVAFGLFAYGIFGLVQARYQRVG